MPRFGNTSQTQQARVQRRKNLILGNAELLRLVQSYYNAEQRKNSIHKNILRVSPQRKNYPSNNEFRAAYAATRNEYRTLRNKNMKARKNMYNAEHAIVKRARHVIPRRNLPVNAHFVFTKVLGVVPSRRKNNNNVFYNAAESLENMLRKGYRTMPRQPRPKNSALNKLYSSVKK